jgi:hypothetical protein
MLDKTVKRAVYAASCFVMYYQKRPEESIAVVLTEEIPNYKTQHYFYGGEKICQPLTNW